MFGIGAGRGHVPGAKPERVARRRTESLVVDPGSSPESVAGAGANPASAATVASSATIEKLDLTQIADGERARVLGFGEGCEAAKLGAMGIVAGAIVEKKSAALMQGPVVIERGRTQLALAYAIARSILVEPLG